MTKNNVAILVDSGCDLPEEICKKHKIFKLPFSLMFKSAIYRDDTISTYDLYRLMEQEIPKTSFPSGEEVEKMLLRISKEGYTKILAVSISSRLSGTCNMLRLHAKRHANLEIEVIDSCNISIGAGMLALNAAEYLAQGMSWPHLKERLIKEVHNSKVFFCLKTLEYLKQGGRIGHVSALLGNALRIKPIITCDFEGIYTTEAKVAGYKQALQRLSECAAHFAAKAPVQLAIMHGAAATEAALVKERVCSLLPHAKLIIEEQISPSMAVHTGPGLVGIGVFKEIVNT
ncbi:MAG: DegV family protein [Firmicutes bacterium]|nr:DegV family protein [Bacillota bacterium]